jgi:hypothetical protein
LIALIINAHPLGSGNRASVLRSLRSLEQFAGPDIDLERPACFGSFRRRRSSSRHKAPARDLVTSRFSSHATQSRPMPGDCASVTTFHHKDVRRDRLSERSYLFTMSDITHPRDASRL